MAVRLLVAGLTAVLCAATSAAAQTEPCGSLRNHYGPYDYRVDRKQLPVVENAHFTPMIEALVRGTTTSSVEGDISYTLRAFPNHPRALAAVVRLAQRVNSNHPRGLHYSVDCFFERALRFRPDDSVVRMLYAQWLGQTGRRDTGLQQLSLIEHGDNPLTVYNLGLVHAELHSYEKALELAHHAQAMGDPRPALRDILQKAGQWRDALLPGNKGAASAAAGLRVP